MILLVNTLLLFVVLGSLSIGTPCSIARAESDDLAANTTELFHERRMMVDTQLQGRGREAITDQTVLGAMFKVPRHRFIPETNRRLAYSDGPVPIGHGQTISQPYIVALMTQSLGLKPGMKVLEVGTGSGYQAAILAEITPYVFTIELLKTLHEFSKKNLTDLGYHDVRLHNGDGYYGWPEYAPFDRIIVTCAALHIPIPLMDQLKPGGKMIIPVGGQFETQRLLLVSKDLYGSRRSETVTLVRFVPLLRGAPPRDD